MKDMINLVDGLEEDENKIPIEVAHYLDNLTKPLNEEKSTLEFNLYSSGTLLLQSKKLTISSRNKVQRIIERKRIVGGVMYGLLKEINLKDYSAKIELFNKRLEKFLFEENVWENVRDLLEEKVEVKFEGKGVNKKLISIKTISNLQQKQKMTAKDLLSSGVFGSMKGREDLKDSVGYAKKLADDLFK